uniref:Fascin-like domain-containing protein n=1 Tax=Laticauda laticaudata TaxID=8630 RepID=A0A8C5S329_LATLA
MTYSLEFGLVNAANRYLTAEPFRFQVAATGKQLKPRQVWVLQFVTPHGAGAAGPGEGAAQKVHLISALKRYLAADPNGKVTCDQDKPGPQTFFLLHQYPDGKVSLQNEQSKRFLGGAEDNVTCFAQASSETEKWTLHLAVHPNVAIYNPNRKRYVRCDEKAEVLRCDRDMPWGAESVISIYYDFKGKLLASNGSLVSDVTAQTMYSLEVHGGLVAFRDDEGKYLTGREGSMKTLKMDRPGRDELFSVETSPAQVSLRSSSTNKLVECGLLLIIMSPGSLKSKGKDEKQKGNFPAHCKGLDQISVFQTLCHEDVSTSAPRIPQSSGFWVLKFTHLKSCQVWKTLD